MVAVSQAPSPESNPDSPLPVKATVVHDTTVQADRSEVPVIKHGSGCPVTRGHWSHSNTLPAQLSTKRGTSLNHPNGTHCPCTGRWSSYRLGAIGQTPSWCAASREKEPSVGPAARTQPGLLRKNLADLGDRVLATRFWRICPTEHLPMVGARHTLSRR